MSKEDSTVKTVAIYVCPTSDCKNYYGSNGMPVLEEQFTGPKLEDQTARELEGQSPKRHNRAECPDCRQRGNPVQRIRVAVRVKVPKESPPTPELPSPSLARAS